MKIITLNTWAGNAGLDLLQTFFKKYKNVDIFCLQEIWKVSGGTKKEDVVGIGADHAHTYFDLIRNALPEHAFFFHPHYSNCFGLATFIHKSIDISEEGELFVYKERGTYSTDLKDIGNHARNIQYVAIEQGAKRLGVINFHGLWNGLGKSDTDDRLLQSDKIVGFLKDFPRPYILTGDFNLLPDTKSIQKIEQLGVRNLIREYGITSTRTSLYTKSLQYADYTFVTPDIDVKEFKILPEEVSDHAALYLEIA